MSTRMANNGSLKAACQEILGKYETKLSALGDGGRNRSFLTREEFDIVYSALQRHPKATEKIGCGVSKIFVQRDNYGSYCFHLQRVDGTEEDFSYRKIFKMISPSEESHRYGYSWNAKR